MPSASAFIPLPLANPYLLFIEPLSSPPLDIAFALFAGMFWLSALAFLFGLLAGRIAMKFMTPSTFYGPLTDVIRSADGDDKFITAYVISKIGKEDRLVGYQGTVDSLFRDADRFPSKVVLKDVVPFYLMLGENGPKRVETDQLIDWLVLSAGDWHNIAFSVFQYVEGNDAVEAEPEAAPA